MAARLETARRLSVKNVCLHKGLPLMSGSEEHWHPKDLERAARDFPDLNFIVYHSAFRSLQSSLGAARDGFRASARVDWVTDLCEIRRRNLDVEWSCTSRPDNMTEELAEEMFVAGCCAVFFGGNVNAPGCLEF